MFSSTGEFEITKNPGTRDKHIFRQLMNSPGPGYPNLYVQVTYFVDPKTNLVSPAHRDRDIIILVAPYGVGLSEAFNAPRGGVDKTVDGREITFSFYYTVEIGNVKVSAGFKDFFSIEKEVKPMRGLVVIKGTLNTVTLAHTMTYLKA